MPLCACGCGTVIASIGAGNVPIRYARGHSSRVYHRQPDVERTCVACGRSFVVDPSHARGNRGRFCTRACSNSAKTKPLATMWERVEKTEGCWLWAGASKTGYGYGVVRHKRRAYMTHRIAWELTYGPVPEGLDVLHTCDTPACCRPDHLFVGTAKDNLMDMRAKGRERHRALSGNAHPNARITEDVAVEIKRRLVGRRRGDIPRIAGDLNVTRDVVADIARGRTWKHV